MQLKDDGEMEKGKFKDNGRSSLYPHYYQSFNINNNNI